MARSLSLADRSARSATEREFDLQIALISPLSPLIGTRGYSAPATKAASERAIALCRQTGQVSRIFPALEQHMAQMPQLLEKHGLPVWQASGMPLEGVILGWQGRPQEGRAKAEQGIEMLAGLRFGKYQPFWSLIRAGC